MRRLRLLSIAVLAVLLAGCSQGSRSGDVADAGLGGTAQQTVVDASAGDGSTGPSSGHYVADSSLKGGNGTLRGVVRDDTNITVEKAGVSLLGTSHFHETDGKGQFSFPPVPAGKYRIRVTAPLYLVYEGDVQVLAGKITQLDITLVPEGGRGPGYRPHIHDYWGSRTQATIVDDDIDLHDFPGTVNPAVYADYVTYEYPNTNATMLFALPETTPDGQVALVYPGTKEVHITLSWGGDVQVKKMGLRYYTAGSPDYEWMPPMESGQTFVRTLQDGDADSGHQMFSLWQFWAYTGNAYARATDFSPELIQGPLHVKIDLVKGEVPIEPAHIDFWNGSTQLLLHAYDPPVPDTTVYLEAAHHSMAVLSKGPLVPPGTQRLHVRFGWESSFSGQKPPPSAADGTWELHWRTGDMSPQGTPLSDYKTLPGKSAGTNVVEYDIPVAPVETDAYYQKASNWEFRAVEDTFKAVPQSLTDSEKLFHLELIAYKDPAFS